MSASSRLEELWDHFLQASPGSYERSSFLDVFLADFLRHVKDGKPANEILSFCASAGVTSLIACDLLAEVHKICSQPTVGDDFEDLTAVRKYLLNGPGWRSLAVLHYLGVETLSCGRELASLLITIYPLCIRPSDQTVRVTTSNPYILDKKADKIEDILKKPTKNRKISHGFFSSANTIEYNRSQSNTSTTRLRRRRSTHSCASQEGEGTSESEPTSDDPTKSNTLKIRLNPMDFDYFTSVVRSEDEARLESENYSPKKKVIRDKKKIAQDFIDNDIRDVLSFSLLEDDFFKVVLGLLQGICTAEQNITTLSFQPVCVVTLNFVLEDLCSLQFDSGSLDDVSRVEVAERKSSFARLLLLALEKVLLNEDATTTVIQRGILPVMIKLLEDVVRKFPKSASDISPRVKAQLDQAKYLHEFIFGLTYGILSFLYNLLLQRGSMGKINDFLLLFDLFADSQSGRLLEKSITVILTCLNVDRQLQISRSTILIEFVGHLIHTLKKIRTDITHYRQCRSKRHRQCEGMSTGAHHHQDLFGSVYIASLAGTVSKTAPECSVASLFSMLVRLLRSLPTADAEALSMTLNVMSSCGTCCCFPAGYLLKALAPVLQQGLPKTRLVCLTMLERTLYWELGAYERPRGALSCSICYSEEIGESRNTQEYWSCMDLFSEMLLSPDAKLRQGITSHLLKVAARFTLAVKSKLLFGIFYPVFLKAKARLGQDDKLAQYTVLSCLSLFTSLLWNSGFAYKFIRLKGLDEILQLIVTPTLSELCCSILEITAITDIGSLENAEKDLHKVASVQILEEALLSATEVLLNFMAERKNFSEQVIRSEKKVWSPNTLDSDYRNLSVSDVLKLEGCESTEESYLLTILKACVFWRSCANLTVASPRYRQYIGRELEENSGHQLLRLMASLIAAGTSFTAERCRNLEAHLYIKLTEALLIVNVASGLSADKKVVRANKDSLEEVRLSLLAANRIADVQQICDALISCSMTQTCTNEAPSGKPKLAPMIVALPSEADSFSDEEVEDTYITADEGYDADVEVLALESMDGSSSSSSRSITHPQLCSMAVQLLVAKREQAAPVAVVIHCLQRLIAVSREDTTNCLSLATTGMIGLLLNGFHQALSTNRAEDDELRRVILELVVLLARNRILNHELIIYLRLFTSPSPPLESLLAGLVSLVSCCVPRPHMILAFPTAVEAKPTADLGQGKAGRLQRFFREFQVTSSWSHSAMSIPIRPELGWSMWANGFSTAFWLLVNNVSVEVSHGYRRPSSNSTDDESSEDVPTSWERGVSEQLHLFSIGTELLMFEAWLDSATLSITFKLVKGMETICEETQANVLTSEQWCYLAFNVTSSVYNKRNVIEVQIFVDGMREETLTMSLTGLLSRKSTQTSYLLGSSVAEPSKSRSWFLGNVMLFRAPVWTRERALYMLGLGPNYNCLADCSTHHQSPNFTGVFARSLPYGIHWETILQQNKTLVSSLQEHLLMTYTPHAAHIVNFYPMSTSQSTSQGLLLAGYKMQSASQSASQQIPLTVNPTLFSVISCRHYQGLVSAATVLGGAPVFLFLFARVVELNAAEEAQASALYLLLKLVQSDSQLFSQFSDEHLHKLLLRVFATKQCHMGHHLLKAILDVCCDKPVVQYQPGPATFQVVAQSDAMLVDSFLLGTALVASCGNLQRPGGVAVLNTLVNVLLLLLRDEHPFREFNAAQLNRVHVPEAIILFFKEHFLYKETVPLSATVCSSMVEVVRCLMGAPPSMAHIMALMDCVLLLHSANATYVAHSHNNFYCLLHSKAASKSKNGLQDTSMEREQEEPTSNAQAECARHRAVEGMLVLLRDTLLVIPDSMTSQVLEHIVKLETLVVLANHQDAAVRAAVVMLIASHVHRSSPEAVAKLTLAKSFYLVASQLGLYDASEKLVDACMWLVTACQVTLQDLPWCNLDISGWIPQSFVLLLAVLPVTVHNVSLAHSLTLFLRKIFIQVEAGRKMLLDLGLLEVLLKTIIAVCHVKRVTREDTGLCEQDLLIEDIRVFLIAIVTSAVYASGSHKMQLLSDMCLQLGFLEQREQKECNDSARCISAMRDTQCMVLEAALDIIQNKILALEPKTNYNVTTSSVLMLAASLRLEEDNAAGKQKVLSRGELGERYNTILVKAVEFLISSESLAQSSSMEHSFARRLFSTMLRAMCSILDRTSGQKSVWSSVMWSAKSTLRIQTSCLLVWMISPENLISTRLFTVTTLRGEPKLKEFMTEIFKNSTQIEEKFCVFLWDLINTNTGNMQSPDKRCCEDLSFQLETWNLMIPLFMSSPEIVRDVVQLLLDEIIKSRRMWHQQNNSAMQRSIRKFEDLIESTKISAMSMTRAVVEQQNAERKSLMEHIKAAFSENVQIRMKWSKIIQQLTHERAVWWFPLSYPNCWQLDPTEGPGRVRTRLSRCHLKLQDRYLMRDHPHDIEANNQTDPLSYLFAIDPDSSASSVLIERLHSNEKIRHMSTACIVTPACEVSGELLVGELCLYFVADNSELHGTDMDTAWQFDSIKEILKRRFQLKERAAEIFLVNGTTYLVAFQSAKDRDGFLSVVNECDLPNRVHLDDHQDDAKQLWREGLVTNWEYLTQLNKMAGRSYNDLMQYPVFPFVLADYTSATIDLTQPNVYRNFKKPMAVQDKKNEQHYITNYNYFKQELLEGNQLLSIHSEPFHYGSHYSNSGTVLHFLVRLPPFTSMFLTYQDNNFDLPDRTFHSMHTTWRLASSDSTTDVKELIPEFFYLPEFLENKEGFDFGVRQNGVRVHDVDLPGWCQNNARLFVLIYRQALEAAHVRENLPHWLDLIFGFKQTGKAAIDAINVFHPATYCGFEVESIVDPLERSAWETMVKTYGQTPRQLLKVPHPMVVQALAPHTSKSAVREVLPGVKGLVWGSYVGSPADLDPTIVWTCSHRTPITAFEMLATNEVLGLAQSSSLLVSFSKDKGLGFTHTPILQGVALITWGHADFVIRIKIKKDQIPMPIVRVSALDPVSTCATTPECNQLWIGHQSGKILVYQCHMELAKSLVEFSADPTTLWAHTGCVMTLSLCLSFSIAVSGSADQTVIIWDLNKVSYVRTLRLSSPIDLLTVSQTLGDIALACQNTLHCYTINAASVGVVKLNERITALCFSNAPEGVSVNVIAAGLASGLIRLWSSWDLSVIRDLSTAFLTKPIACITYSADGHHLYAAAVDGTMVIWERPGAKAANKSPKFSNLTFL